MTTKITEQNISNLANLGVEWQDVVVADGSTGLTAVSGRGYFINTTGGIITVTLPSSPNVGDTIILKDYARTWGTNNVTTASTTIDGGLSTPVFSTNGQTVTLVYMDNTRGWSLINEDTTTNLGPLFIEATGGTILTSGDFKTHVFTGDGSFVVSAVGNPFGSTTVEYVVVAGGGSGAGNAYTGAGAGGGGAGGYRQNFPSPTTTGFPVTATTIPVTVGAGGTSNFGSVSSGLGTAGSNSVFSTITSTGGGRGANQPGAGGNGGSGGGGTWVNQGGGSGNTPPTSPSQGNNGGAGSGPAPNPGVAAGGGGGAGATGGVGSPPSVPSGGGGLGGIGSPILDTFFGPTAPSYGTPGPVGSSRYFAGGGGGGTNQPDPYTGSTTLNGFGGSGGGGDGGYGRNSGNRTGLAGTANTGGGGGGSSSGPSPITIGGSGGSGVVLIRYKYQ